MAKKLLPRYYAGVNYPKLEKLIDKLKIEKNEIIKAFEENPTTPLPEKAARLKEIEEETSETETKWLELNEKFYN